jgi:hypothetical protein
MSAASDSMIPFVFAILITLQFLVIVLHDLLDIPGWTHGRQVRATVGPRKFWIATPINAIFPALATGLAIYFLLRPAAAASPSPPRMVANYWVLYCSITVLSAITMWWIPYFLGAKEKTKRDYARMYAGTRHVLPARGPNGDNPRPNLLHLYFHALFVMNLALALMLWWQEGR